MINVVFTDYDTVRIDNAKEIITKEFLDSIEKKIKSGEITSYNYNPETEQFSYIHDSRMYLIKINNKNVHAVRVLFSFLTLKQEKISKKSQTKIMTEETKKILELARMGEIKSEEARQLYLKELQHELKITKIIKNLKLHDIAYSIFNIDINDLSEFSEGVTLILMLFYIFGGFGIFPILSLFDIISSSIAAIIMIVSLIGLEISMATIDTRKGGTLIAKLISCIIWFIINLIGNIIKLNIDFVHSLHEYTKDAKLIKHKINWLKNYKIPSEEKQKNTTTNCIEKYINEIYEKLVMLNDEEKKEMLVELLAKINEYRTELANIPQSGLTLETEGTINTRFITYLTELELKINQKINKTTPSVELIKKENITNNKVKKRVLQI